MELIIVTGLSGAGKSAVVDVLEDIGFFCADNMPPKLISTFAKLLANSKEKRERIAIVMDIRLGGSFKDLFAALDDLAKMDVRYKVLFVDASNEVLMRRYKETRRKHPLMDKCGSINKAINMEREMLLPARQIADYIVDTSHTTSAQCKEMIAKLFLDNPQNTMKIRCISFGYKYGMPNDSDLVFDVRCLPNPFYINELRDLTGLDEPIKEYVLKWPQAKDLIPKLLDLIDYLVPLYIAEGKSELVIAIGCTGGHHRSVVFAELIHEHLSEQGYLLSVNHRDINK
ncbi:MAG TPA: RNase adapter RapZ [Clostridia bacterium]|nr:RNase adapter RapZ [Clostridia bacterium]